jgi:hypothetical protein
MSDDPRDRVRAASRELCSFLQRVENLAAGKNDIGPDDLSRIKALLHTVGAVISNSQHAIAADPDLQVLLKEYASNLRATQKALEQVQCVMLARRAQMDQERGRIDQFQSWANAYRQTT